MENFAVRFVVGPDNSFARSVASFVRTQLRLAEATARRAVENSGGAGMGSRAPYRAPDPFGNLERLALYLDGCDRDNQMVRALQLVNEGTREYDPPLAGRQGTGDGHRPGNQRALIGALINWSQPSPGHLAGEVPPEIALAALVAAAVEDASAVARQFRAAGKEAVTVAESRAARIEELEGSLAEAAGELSELFGERDEAVAEAARLTEENEFLRSVAPAAFSGDVDEGPTDSFTAVSGHSNVYHAVTPSGLRYKVGFRDSEGNRKQKWVPAGATLEDAVAMRDELDGEKAVA